MDVGSHLLAVLVLLVNLAVMLSHPDSGLHVGCQPLVALHPLPCHPNCARIVGCQLHCLVLLDLAVLSSHHSASVAVALVLMVGLVVV